MRTTVDLPDELYRSVKTAAVERGVPFKTLVREALEKAYVAEEPELQEPSWVRACRNPPLTKEDTDAMLAVIAEMDRVDLEWQASGRSDHWKDM